MSPPAVRQCLKTRPEHHDGQVFPGQALRRQVGGVLEFSIGGAPPWNVSARSRSFGMRGEQQTGRDGTDDDCRVMVVRPGVRVSYGCRAVPWVTTGVAPV